MIEATPDLSYLEEELAAAAITTASSKEVETIMTDLPYSEISWDSQTYLAFWFIWNEETLFLPIAQSKSDDINFLSCQADSGMEIEIGKIFSGLKFVQNECVLDKKIMENKASII